MRGFMRGRLIEFLVLLTVAIGAAPVGAAFWQWSTTAATNATADPSINWAENMAPSAVNDSARAMMAVLAGWRNDVSGRLITTGTSTAYVLATSQNFDTSAHMDGAEIAFTAHVTNGSAPTLAVDSVAAAPLIIDAVSGQNPAPPGALTAGSVYTAVYYNSGPSWRLKDYYANTFGTALGGIMWSTSPTPPNANFVAPSGQCISTTTYAAYWVQQGSPASGACPGGQFAIIDMRGRVAAGLDTLNASAANRLTNSATGCGTAMTSVGAVCSTGNESQTLTTLNLPPYTPSGVLVVGLVTFPNVDNTSTANGSGGAITTGTNAGSTLDLTGRLKPLQAASSWTGNAQGGTSTPFPRLAPTIGLIPYLRIL